MRGPLARYPVPLARTRRADFDALVMAAVERLSAAMDAEDAARLADVAFVVAEVPTGAAVEGAARDGRPEVPLGAVEVSEDGAGGTVIVFRRPCTARALRGAELSDLVDDVVVAKVAELLGLDADDLGGGAAD
jgi:hypothetical protein